MHAIYGQKRHLWMIALIDRPQYPFDRGIRQPMERTMITGTGPDRSLKNTHISVDTQVFISSIDRFRLFYGLFPPARFWQVLASFIFRQLSEIPVLWAYLTPFESGSPHLQRNSSQGGTYDIRSAHKSSPAAIPQSGWEKLFHRMSAV